MATDRTFRVALAGNPNVGKSTVFNALTGLHQHTGNWPGKTVGAACGRYTHRGDTYILHDLPGTYSLCPHSPEEAAARDHLCFSAPHAVVAVCDAAALERGLPLVLQVLELCGRAVLCLNLWDEARKKQIRIRTDILERELGIPVVCTSARSGRGLAQLKNAVAAVCRGDPLPPRAPRLPPPMGACTAAMHRALAEELPHAPVSLPWLARMLCEEDSAAISAAQAYIKEDLAASSAVTQILHTAEQVLSLPPAERKRRDTAAFILEAEGICAEALACPARRDQGTERHIDRVLLGRFTALPFMLLLLGAVLWITVVFSNVPSSWLMTMLMQWGEALRGAFTAMHLPPAGVSLLIDGVWRVTAWVTAVMLPPMAIFFPLFTLLEDAGFLPRVAFNMDPLFQKAGACGKQALTMCMGFGCNALGIRGCRIIDSPREQRLAMLTNVFVPCNGRFPFLIALTSLFFSAQASDGGLVGACVLTAAVAGSIGISLLVCRGLSRTLLQGTPSAFTLELPPYRCPQIGTVLLHGVVDRVVFVLGRALKTAAPAGLLIWLLANIAPGGESLLLRCAALLEPLGRLLGMDGVILLAFLLGFPANEIVLPILLMGYLGSGTLTEAADLAALGKILQANGWDAGTALCTLVFALMHWPCAASCCAVYRETRSAAAVLWAAVIPTAAGCGLCLLIQGVRLLLRL